MCRGGAFITVHQQACPRLMHGKDSQGIRCISLHGRALCKQNVDRNELLWVACAARRQGVEACVRFCDACDSPRLSEAMASSLPCGWIISPPAETLIRFDVSSST